MAIAGSLVTTASAKTDDFQQGMRRMRSELSGVRQDADQTARAFASLSSAVTAPLAGIVSVGAAIAGLRDVVQTGLQLDRLRNSFTVIAGSAQLGRQEFEFVSQVAGRLGQDVLTLSESYRSLLAATRGTELAGRDSRALFEALTRASQAYGLTTEQTGRALTAFQQIISKGKVSQEELRQQLGEALPGASQIAARAYGVTTAELDKMIEKGVSATDFTRKFTEQLTKETPAATQIAGKGFSDLGNEILALKDRIAQSGVVAVLDRLAGVAAGGLRGSREQSAEQRAAAERVATRSLRGESPRTLLAKDAEELMGLSERLVQAEQRLASAQDELTAAAPGGGPAGLITRMAAQRVKNAQEEIDSLRRQMTELAAMAELRRAQQREGEARGGLLTEIGPQFDAQQQAARRQAEQQRKLDADQIQTDLGGIMQRTEAIESQEKDLGEMRKQLAQGVKQEALETIQRQKTYLDGLQKERDGLAMTRTELALKVLAEQPLEPAQRTRAEGLLEEIRLLHERNELAEELNEAEMAGIREGQRLAEERRRSEEQDRRDAEREAREDAREQVREMRRQTQEFSDFFSETILSTTEIGKRGFSSFADSVIADLQRLLVRQYLAPALNQAILGGIQAGIGLFAGASQTPTNTSGAGLAEAAGILVGSVPTRQHGGPVWPGQPFLVGEAGPELFMPDQAGQIYPNASGAPHITINFNGPTDTATVMRSQGQIRGAIARAYQSALQDT